MLSATASLGQQANAPAVDPVFLAAFRDGSLTVAQAEAALPIDRIAVVFLLLQLSAAVARDPSSPESAQPGPHTPSGSVPPYLKPTPDPKKRCGKPGAVPGHAGTSRPMPTRIDRTVHHALPVCPCCGGALHRTGRSRTRIIEDIPENTRAETTQHTLDRDWCPACKKQVEPVVADALPNCRLGHRTVTLTAWLHYGLGTTTSQIAEVLNGHLQLPISGGGLTGIWHRLAEVLLPWYVAIHQHCLAAPVLHGDETGWRNAGKTVWLWCFASDDATYYLIHPRRGHEALRVIFTEPFKGVLVTDFLKAYDIVCDRQQKCWAHLLREVAAADDAAEAEDAAKAKGGAEAKGKPSKMGPDWSRFSTRLWKIYGDAVQLAAQRETLGLETVELRTERLRGRLLDLALGTWQDTTARRLAGRLRTYGDDLLRFLEEPGVPTTNNKAEREIRPAVLMRKVSQGSGSERGSATRSVLMSIYRTLKQRGLDPLHETEKALRAYMETGTLPPLPAKTQS